MCCHRAISIRISDPSSGSVECTNKQIEDPETAVKMVCTNKQCTKPSLLHARCFDKLEKHLLKALAASPMGRKWTEAQLEANVWNGRGVDVLYKYSRCSCGGTLSKPEEESEVPMPVAKKKEKEKSSQKPKLNCDGVKISYSGMKMFKQVTDQNAQVRAPRYHHPQDPKTTAMNPGMEKLPRAEENPAEVRVDPLQLFVGFLPNTCTEAQLFELFGKFGKVTKVDLHHPSTQTDNFVPSFAYVAFDSNTSVQRTLAARPIKLYGDQKMKVEEKRICTSWPSKKQSIPIKASKAKQVPSESSPKPWSLPLLKADLPKNKYIKSNGIGSGVVGRENYPKILHVSHLPEGCSENDLGEIFEEYGEVSLCLLLQRKKKQNCVFSPHTQYGCTR